MPSSSASAHAQAAREGFRARKSLGVTTLAVPESTDAEYTLAENGTFVEGDLSVTAHGLVINNAGESDRAGAQLAATEAAAAASRSVGQGAFATLNLDALSVQGTIGAGSSGVVQRVVYGKQTYALKLIQVEMAQQARKQLCTELRTLSGALHPNIVVFHHAFTDKGCVSILMEYMDAGSLFDILKQKKRIPEHHITTIARQVLSGLQYLHKELRVVHRDVKARTSHSRVRQHGDDNRLTPSLPTNAALESACEQTRCHQNLGLWRIRTGGQLNEQVRHVGGNGHVHEPGAHQREALFVRQRLLEPWADPVRVRGGPVPVRERRLRGGRIIKRRVREPARAARVLGSPRPHRDEASAAP